MEFIKFCLWSHTSVNILKQLLVDKWVIVQKVGSSSSFSFHNNNNNKQHQQQSTPYTRLEQNKSRRCKYYNCIMKYQRYIVIKKAGHRNPISGWRISANRMSGDGLIGQLTKKKLSFCYDQHFYRSVGSAYGTTDSLTTSPTSPNRPRKPNFLHGKPARIYDEHSVVSHGSSQLFRSQSLKQSCSASGQNFPRTPFRGTFFFAYLWNIDKCVVNNWEMHKR